MTTAADKGSALHRDPAHESIDAAAVDTLAPLLVRHLHPQRARETLLVGPASDSLAAMFASGTRSADGSDVHIFKSAVDVQDFLSGVVAPTTERQQICLIDAFIHQPDCRPLVLAALRDRYGCRILHLESDMYGDNPWQLTDSLALGYRCIDSGHQQETRWSLFEFNLLTYKTTPDWLNSDHWCHPEQWDRSRW